jgi:hypothetical protein
MFNQLPPRSPIGAWLDYWKSDWSRIENGLLEHNPTKLRVALVCDYAGVVNAYATDDSAHTFVSNELFATMSSEQVIGLSEVLLLEAAKWNRALKTSDVSDN